MNDTTQQSSDYVQTRESLHCKRNNNHIYMLLFIVFLDMWCVGLVVPLFPYYATQVGADPATYGLMMSLYGTLQLIGSPIMGRLSDRHHMGRRAVLCLSLLSSAISYFLVGAAGHLWVLFLSFIIQSVSSLHKYYYSRIPVGLFKHTTSISYAFVTDLTHEEDRSQYLAYIGVASSMGFIVGPAIGGILSEFSYNLPAYISCSLYTLLLILVLIFLPRNQENPNGRRKDDIPEERTSTMEMFSAFVSGFIDTLGSNNLRILFMLSFTFTLGWSLYRSNFSLIVLEQYGVSARLNGFLLAYFSMLGVITQGFLVKLFIQHFEESRVMMYSIAGLSVSLVFVGVSTQFNQLLVGMIPLAVFSGLLKTTILSNITKNAPERSVGATIGVAGSLESIVRAIAPGVGGTVMKYGGVAAPAWIGSSLLGILFLATFAAGSEVLKLHVP